MADVLEERIDTVEANADAVVALLVASPTLTLRASRQVDLAGFVVVDGVVLVGTRLALRLQARAIASAPFGGGAE